MDNLFFLKQMLFVKVFALFAAVFGGDPLAHVDRLAKNYRYAAHLRADCVCVCLPASAVLCGAGFVLRLGYVAEGSGQTHLYHRRYGGVCLAGAPGSHFVAAGDPAHETLALAAVAPDGVYYLALGDRAFLDDDQGRI